MEVATIMAAIITVLIGLGFIFVVFYALDFFTLMGGKNSRYIDNE